MIELVDRFTSSARACATFSELGGLLEQAVFELGFTYFALLHHCAADGRSRSPLKLDNYPQEWALERQSKLRLAADPVHQASRRTNISFSWNDIGSLVELSREQQAFLRDCRSFGLGDGMTVPANIPGEPPGSFSIATREGRKFPQQHSHLAEIIGAYAFDAARRLCGVKGYCSRPHLSRREVDCLRLIAIGKSDWEIARILGLSFETVRQYVKRARVAYGVSTRTQLVVMGLRDDWICIDEVATRSRFA